MKPFWRRAAKSETTPALSVTIPEGDCPEESFRVALDEASLRVFVEELAFFMDPPHFSRMMVRLYGGTLLSAPDPDAVILRSPGWHGGFFGQAVSDAAFDADGLFRDSENPVADDHGQDGHTEDLADEPLREPHPCALTWRDADVRPGLVITAGQPHTPVPVDAGPGLEALALALAGTGRCAVLVEQVREDGAGEVSEAFEVPALLLQLPGCPHEVVEALRPLARHYLGHPSFDPDKGGQLLAWRTARVALLIVMPGARPQLHLCVPGHDWPQESSLCGQERLAQLN